MHRREGNVSYWTFAANAGELRLYPGNFARNWLSCLAHCNRLIGGTPKVVINLLRLYLLQVRQIGRLLRCLYHVSLVYWRAGHECTAVWRLEKRVWLLKLSLAFIKQLPMTNRKGRLPFLLLTLSILFLRTNVDASTQLACWWAITIHLVKQFSVLFCNLGLIPPLLGN